MTNELVDRNPVFALAFAVEAKQLFRKYPHIAHKWSIGDDQDVCALVIPKSSDEGFDISFYVTAEEVTVHCASFHEHYSIEGDVIEFAAYCIGMLYDLLTPTMRVRISSAGATPYKWTLEMLEKNKWLQQGSTALIFYNYFSKRSETILQNSALEARLY